MANKSIGSLFIDIEARTAKLEQDLGKAKQAIAGITAGNQAVARSAKDAASAFDKAEQAVGRVALRAIFGAHMFSILHHEVRNVFENIDKLPGIPAETIQSVHEMHEGVQRIKHGLDLAIASSANFMVQWGTMIGVTLAKEAGYNDTSGLHKLESADEAAALKDPGYWDKVAAARKAAAQAAEADKMAQMDLGTRMDYLLSRAEEYEKVAHQTGVTALFRLETEKRASDARKTVDAEDTKLQKEYSDTVTKILNQQTEMNNVHEGTIAKVKRLQIEYDKLGKIVTPVVGHSFSEAGAGHTEELLSQVAAAKRMVVVGTELQAALKRLKEPMDIMRDTFTSHIEGMGDVLAKFMTRGESGFRDFFRTLLDTMVSTFLKLSIINPLLNMAFGGMAGYTALPSFFADGGPYTGGPFIAGERGPELVIPGGSSGTVITAGRTSGMMAASGSGAGGGNIIVNQTFTSGLTHQEFMATLPSIIERTKQAVRDGVQRGGGYSRVFANA